ncbi:hypothetical protein [Streptomyces sp. NPDC059460]
MSPGPVTHAGRRGPIRRDRDPEDRRRLRVALTEAGLQLQLP